jgi:HK97 family phage prohead protease
MAANQHSAKHKNSGTRDMPALSMRAAIVPSSIDAEKRTVELVWTTGARVMRGFFERYWEELSVSAKHVRMERLSSGTAPLLNAHNGYDLGGVIGVVEKAWLKNKEGGARVRFAKAEDDPEADQIFRKVMDGIIRNVSVGYRVHKLEKVEDGADQIPVYRATDWEPYEISMVPVGADAGAGVRAEGADTNPCEVIGLAYQERRMDEDEDEKTPAPAPKPKNEERHIDEAALRKEAMASERKRIADIQGAARALSLDDEFAKRHIDAGTEMDEFRKLAIDERASKAKPIVDPGGRVDAVRGGDEHDKWQRGASDWLMIRAGVHQTVMAAAKKRGETLMVDPGEFRGRSLVELARQSLERKGVRTDGMDKRVMVGKALTMRSGGYASTGDFSVLLEEVLRKTLLGAYETADDTWRLFCKIGTVSDFRAHHRYRTGAFGRLDVVNEHGEYTRKPIRDGVKESISADTMGNTIAITRQSIIDDDMGAFSTLATDFGSAAGLTLELMVYELLAENSGVGPNMADGNPLFHSSHSNVGTASALTVAGIDADRQLMARQKDPNNVRFLNMRPAILLVSLSLGSQARVINGDILDSDAIDPGTDEQMKFGRTNPMRGQFRTIVDTPYITTTRRYLFADPARNPTIEVVFLDGQQAPLVEMRPGWDVDGVEWKLTMDAGAGAVDYRTAVTNVGTP